MKRFSSHEATILLMDSDVPMRAALRDALQSAGYLVETAGGLGEAVDRLEELRPALLITSPYIKSMPGYVAAQYLRSKCPGLPVLIVAGFLDDDRSSVPNAVEDYFTFPKPFSLAELLAKVKEVLNVVRERKQ